MSERDHPDTVGRFNDRVADYVKYRPTYPVEAIDAIVGGLGPRKMGRVALVYETEVFLSNKV